MNIFVEDGNIERSILLSCFAQKYSVSSRERTSSLPISTAPYQQSGIVAIKFHFAFSTIIKLHTRCYFIFIIFFFKGSVHGTRLFFFFLRTVLNGSMSSL